MEKGLRMALPLGFEVRLLELPQGEDPDTWCLKLGAEAFRDLLRASPDWTAFMVDRALEGKDLRRITDRMGAFKDLLDFLPFLPRTPETRELFASLAHQLQLPLQELDRAVGARRQAPATTPGPSLPMAIPDLDEQIRALLLLCREGQWHRVQEIPAAWWESRTGAPLLQALLDLDGDPALLPPEALAAVRHLEAQATRQEDGDARDAEALFVRIEAGYVDREIQANNRLLQEPRTLADREVTTRLMARQNDLLNRKKELSHRRRMRR
jgi:DNA primase